MKTKLIKFFNYIMFSAMLPLLAGCNGGGGGGDGASAVSGASYVLPVEQLDIMTGDGGVLTQVHNPEPATMLLLGGGVLAMGYLKKKNSVK